LEAYIGQAVGSELDVMVLIGGALFTSPVVIQEEIIVF
jgi:hypothetical protein